VVTNGIPNAVAGYVASITGNLKPLPGSPFPTYPGLPLDNPQRAAPRLAYDRLAGTLFAVDTAASTITPRVVQTDGTLSYAPTFSAGGERPEGLALDPVQRMLYVALTADGQLNAFRLSPTGVATPAPGFPIAAGGVPADLVLDSTGERLYVSLTAAHAIAVFARMADETLVPVPSSPMPTGSCPPTGLALAPERDRLLVACDSDPMEILAFAINSDGGLSGRTEVAVGGVAGQEVAWLGETSVAIVANAESNDFGGAALADDGILVALSGTPFPGPTGASGSIGLGAGPDGAVIFASHAKEKAMSALLVLPNGSLISGPLPPVPTGQTAGEPLGGVLVLDPRDPDADEVPTFLDNCPEVANPEQADSDGDGVGDLCAVPE
jgi:hypothetical protein